MRRRYFIKRAFQARFFTRFVVLLIVQALLITGIFMFISGQTLTSGYYGSEFVVDRTSHFFFTPFVIMSFVVGILMVASGIFSFILLSHRIAGPLYRFEKTLQDVSLGMLTIRVTLRRTDELKDIQAVLNTLLYRFDTNIKEIKDDLSNVQKLMSEQVNEKSLQEIRDELARIDKKLAFFKTS